MALQPSQSVVTTGTTPSVITPTVSDTIAAASFGVAGVYMRVITTGTASNVATLDPNFTTLSNPGTVTPVACPATGIRMILIPRSAISPATGVATVTFSSITGATYELFAA